MLFVLATEALLPLFPNDFFPYLRIGEEIIKTGHIPATEFMTYTQFGNPAVYLYWLPSIMFFGLYKLGGATLTTIVSIFCTGAFYSFLWLSLRKLNISRLTTGSVLVFLAVSGAAYFPARPQLLAYPLFGLAILVILSWQNGENRLLWLLPLIALLWANIHGSFIVLFLLLIPAIVFGSGNRKRLVFFAVISLLSTLINYYGLDLWASALSMVDNPSIKLFSAEWGAPANQDLPSYIFFMTLLLIPLLTAFTKPRIKIIYWIWYVGFGWMALTSLRYTIWFLPFEVIILSMLLDPFVEKKLQNSNHFQNRTINMVIGICLLIAPFAFVPGVRNHWWKESPPIFSSTTPVEAAQWLEQNPQLPGNIWSDFNYSTYLAYALPQRKLFMTNRFEDFTITQLEEDQRITSAKYNWRSILEKYKINLVMPSILREPDLIMALSSSAEWKEIYRDDRAVIFVRIP